MKLLLYDRLYLETAGISDAHMLKLKEMFTPFNPKFVFEEKSGRSTRGVSRRIKMYEEVDGFFTLPIGILHKVLDFLTWYGYKYEVVDKRVEGADIEFDFDPTVTLEDYQEEAVQALLNSKTCNGLVQAPPGAGKTLLSLNYISRIKKKALIIVHENRLFDQWVQEIERRGKGKFTLGVFNGDLHTFGDITLVLIQSGYRYKDTYPEFADFGVVIVDECLHPDTLIRIPTGEAPLRNLKVGDLVTTPTGNSSRISQIHHTKKLAYRYTTSSGKTIVASDNHIVPVVGALTHNRSTAVVNKKIRDTDHLLAVSQDWDMSKLPYDSEEYVFGLFLGDGTCDRNTIKFGYRKDVELLDGIFSKHIGSNRYTRSTNSRGDTIFTLENTYAKHLISTYGIKSGKKSDKLLIPDFLFDKKSVGVVKGLMDSDGHRADNKIEINLVSKTCILQIQQILEHYGIFSRVYTYHKRNPKHLPLHRLSIYGDNVIRYQLLFGFELHSKNKSFTLIKRPHLFTKEIITDIAPVGEEELIDISLDDGNKLFIANGLVVHNCHHSSASTGIFAKLLHNLPAKYKFGVSGTLKRKDKMDFVIEYFLGKKLIDIPESRTKNRITDFSVEFIDTHVAIDLPWNTRDKKPAYTIQEKDGKEVQVKNYLRLKTHELLAAITGFQGSDSYSKSISDEELIQLGLSGATRARNQLILDKVIADIKMGHFPLVLTNRTMHAKFIFAYLRREGYNGVILTGKTAGDYSVAEIRDAPQANGEKIYFIVASERIAAEALDISYLSSLHILIPSQNQFKLKQCLGRIRRRASVEKLSPVVRDYVDRESGALPGEEDYFEKSAKNRRSHYNKWQRDYAQA